MSLGFPLTIQEDFLHGVTVYLVSCDGSIATFLLARVSTSTGKKHLDLCACCCIFV